MSKLPLPLTSGLAAETVRRGQTDNTAASLRQIAGAGDWRGDGRVVGEIEDKVAVIRHCGGRRETAGGAIIAETGLFHGI